MKYNNIKKAKFISRPNRFIAVIEIQGIQEICHVKNTGRCKELLVPGAEVFIQEAENSNRKTKYDLIAVYKGVRLINIDSQIPNKIFNEWLGEGVLFKNISYLKSEYKYLNSRFDFYLENENKKTLIEVKGVTLEENGVVLFPDAPTERGLKHIKHLCQAVADGYEAYIVFIVQMQDVLYFEPNRSTHSAFAEALVRAEEAGVKIIALDCVVYPDDIKVNNRLEVKLFGV
ncbi:MAG: DNA/RNA nuclease SfsA [Peptococcaceae bacterium]|nr:DNA/RNA nuclease SfsA [Peptococcaceae bacterium]